MDALVFLDDQIVSGKDAKISLFDLGIMRGYGVFDFFCVYNRTPFHLWDHLNRFEASAKAIDLTLPYTLDEIANIVQKLIDKAPYVHANMKLFLTGGISADQYLPDDRPTFFALIYPKESSPEVLYTKGVGLMTTIYERPYPSAKTIPYLHTIVKVREAQKKGPNDVLYLHREKNILETGTANFFGIKNDTVITPDTGFIYGVTRKVVMQFLEKRGIPCEVRPLSFDELATFDGAFITSSRKEVAPVTQIDELFFSPHPLATLLRQDYLDYANSFQKIIA